MRTNRTLATLGVVVVLLIAAGMAGMRVFAAPSREDGGGPVVKRPLDVGRFTSIELRGAWKLQFTRASQYRVVLAGDPEFIDATEVSTDGDRLGIYLEQHSDEDRGMRITIAAPTLTALTVAGAVDGRIVELDADQVAVVTKGASNLVFVDSTIGDLALTTEGATNINLEASSVTNAVLDMAGASQLKINLSGGSLTGRVRGAGNIRYSGDADAVGLDTAGLVKVSRKQR